MRMLSLSPLTVSPCSPIDHIEAARVAGFDAIGLRLLPVMPTDVDIMADEPLRRAIERRLSAANLRVLDVEVCRVGPATDIPALEPVLSFSAALGAQYLAFTSMAPADGVAKEEQATARKIGELCELASRYRIKPALEFIVFRDIARLEDAVRMVNLVGHPNIAITIDALHLHRSGGTPAAVAQLDPRLISCVQLCDAPAALPPAAAIPKEARSGRLYPGEGGLPLRELIEALPADTPLSLEAPCPAKSGNTTVERAVEIMSSARRLLATVRHCAA